jgi:hypothetical protein
MSPPTIQVPDYLTPDGAAILAQRLVHYWERQGFAVRAWVEYEQRLIRNGDNAVRNIPVIRSNLVNGCPLHRVRMQ